MVKKLGVSLLVIFAMAFLGTISAEAKPKKSHGYHKASKYMSEKKKKKKKTIAKSEKKQKREIASNKKKKSKKKKRH